MALTAEQQVLVTGIAQRVAEMQSAVTRALPGNAGLHAEFKVGTPAPTTPAQAIALGRALEPLAKEYRTLLVGRGIDGAKVNHLAQMVATLEKLAAAVPAAEVPAAEVPAAGETRKAKKKS